MKEVISVTTVEFRESVSECINKVSYGKCRIILTRRGKPLAALVSLDELGDIEFEEVVSGK